ncbi:hypothetical protein KC571_03625 [candidate division WWE3 bacterium]|uniref:Uncharacterized protein n=1 Tax=candidate division WWE3 bacterium TaxID=2053526 RepID=A0A955LH54_UNCKA|nr:hypothetical protein [candidate division WWE3 bacterium]
MSEKPITDGILITFGSFELLEKIQALCLSIDVALDNPDVILLAGIFPKDLMTIVRSVKAYHAMHEVEGPIVILTFDHPSYPDRDDQRRQVKTLKLLLEEEGYTNIQIVEQ